MLSLIYAISHNQIDLNNELYVDNNIEGGWRPLHFACFKNNRKAVEILLARGADPTIKTNTGRLPIELTADESIISLLRMESNNDD